MRLVVAGTDIRSVDDLAAWAYTVASRLAVDDARRRRITAVPLEEDVVGYDDPASIAEARDEWSRVVAAVNRLSPTDRTALMSVFEEAPDNRVEAMRWAVRRHRARLRLAAMLGKLGSVAAGAWLGGRRLYRLPPVTTPAAAVPAALLVSLWAPFTASTSEQRRVAVPPHEATASRSLQEAAAEPTSTRLPAVVPRQRPAPAPGLRHAVPAGTEAEGSPPPGRAATVRGTSGDERSRRRFATVVDQRATALLPLGVAELYRAGDGL